MSSSERRPSPPQPSTRLNPAPSFSWLDPTPAPADGHERRAQVARAEIADRAGLLYRLGYAEAEAIARLAGRTAWEFDPGSRAGQGEHGRPEALSDLEIAKIVTETYARRP